MMCADFLHLKEELDLMHEFKIDLLHVDIMDGKYVPNFTLGPDFAKSLASYSDIPLDFHLMVEEVDKFIEIFAPIGKSRFCFHPETTRHPVRTIQKAADLGAIPAIAIDPAVPVDYFKHLLPLVGQVCVMTVNPGYAGQKLVPFCLDKIAELREWKEKEGLGFEIEVDGNVSWENIPKMIKAGAEILVVGTSSVFKSFENRRNDWSRLMEEVSN